MQEQRYVVKFNNGAWKVFDNHEYNDVKLHYLKLHYLKVEAERHAEFLNK